MAKISRAVGKARHAIAAQAARLIAEDGLADYGAAKRKAARQLGFRDSDGLPDNTEIEEALRAYQSLYQNQEQRTRLAELRRVGLCVMRDFAAHCPYMSGPVWNGTATRGARVDIDLFTDMPKQLELSLINRGIPYVTTAHPHFLKGDKARVLVLVFEVDDVEVGLSIYTAADERDARKTGPAGRPDRGMEAEVEALLASARDEAGIERFLAEIR